MIELYSGTPGSGKSLHIARDIYYYLNTMKDYLVICNFEIDLNRVKHEERFVFIDNNDISASSIISLCIEHFKDRPVVENEVILIIDECQLLFNTRDWARADRRGWLSFFSQHRKYGIRCKLVAQYDEMIDKQIRALIETEYLHRKVTNYGVIGFFIWLFMFGKELFVAQEYWYPINKQTGYSFFTARKKYYTLYNTFNTFNSDMLNV